MAVKMARTASFDNAASALLRALDPVERARRLGGVSARWLCGDYAPRLRAIDRLERRALYAPAQSRRLIDGLFGGLSAAALTKILPADRRVLDAAPEWCVQVHASGSPQPAIEAVALSLLAGCAVVLKPSSSDPGLLAEYVASLRREDPKLGRCVYPLRARDRRRLRRVLREAPLVIAYGSDRTIELLRRQIGPGARYAPHGHRMSLSILTSAALASGPARLAKSTALDVWMDRQQGCLSPRVVYVQGGGAGTELFAERLADELELLTRNDPMTPRAERNAVSRLRQLYRLRAALGERILWRERRGRGRYAVMYDELPGRRPDAFVPLCVSVKAFKERRRLLGGLRGLQGYIQGIALGATPAEAPVWRHELSALDPALVTVPGRLQFPRLSWRHDNRPRLWDWLSTSA